MTIETIAPDSEEYLRAIRQHNETPKARRKRRFNAEVYRELAGSYNAAARGAALRFKLEGRVSYGNIVRVLENKGIRNYEDFETSREKVEVEEGTTYSQFLLLKLTGTHMHVKQKGEEV
jgi:hypothetical protein